MRDFEYAAPTTLAAAVEVLSRWNGRSKPLAGGTDLIDHVRTGRLAPDMLVDIKKIPELNILEAGPDGLRLGAAVCCTTIARHAAIRTHYAALADSAAIIGGVQIQNRASFGGNLCNAGPAADSTPSLIALSARCVIAGAAGRREVPVEQFCTAPGKNVLQPGELLVELVFPALAACSGSHYRRFIPRNEMDIAVVGVGASVTLDVARQRITAARIALGAVGPTPIFAADASASLVGQPVDDALLKHAATKAREVATPIDDMRGPREYRLHLVGVLVERTLRAAISRARGEPLDYRPGH
jgi:carbon-monoxide dehydrogenase medium subunit